MKTPVHPGCILKNSILDLNMTTAGAANALGVTRPVLSKLLSARSSVTPDMAVCLARAFGSTPEFWLRLQHNYDLAQVRE